MTAYPSIDQWHRGVHSSVRLPTVLGMAILLVCVGGFGVWAALAPLDGAVVVSGSFVAVGVLLPFVFGGAGVTGVSAVFVASPLGRVLAF